MNNPILLNTFYFNGHYIQGDHVSISIKDRGLTLGDGLFETIYINSSGNIPALNAHWERLVRGMDVLKIPCPFNKTNLIDIISQLIKQNNLSGKTSYVRLMVTRGPTERGILIPQDMHPSVLVTAGLNVATKSTLKLTMSPYRVDELSPLTQIKHSNYLSNILAREEAVQKGFDDAILLNMQSFVAETTIANIFAIVNDTIFTPPLTDGVLPGTTRSTILSLAKNNNINIFEEQLTFANLLAAEFCFASNSIMLCKPIYQIEDRYFNNNSKIYKIIEHALINFYESIYTNYE